MEQVLSSVQQIFEYVIQWAILLCEVIGVAVIVVTAIKGVIACFKKDTHVKLMIAEGIALALTFKMGGELLRSVLVREWGELLILGAIIALRALMTLMIHFEIKSERRILHDLPDKPEESKKHPPIVKL